MVPTILLRSSNFRAGDSRARPDRRGALRTVATRRARRRGRRAPFEVVDSQAGSGVPNANRTCVGTPQAREIEGIRLVGPGPAVVPRSIHRGRRACPSAPVGADSGARFARESTGGPGAAQPARSPLRARLAVRSAPPPLPGDEGHTQERGSLGSSARTPAWPASPTGAPGPPPAVGAVSDRP